ncbi:MAG: hypothetical protein ABI689_10530 [Thermoanaerobaculia bacterium]
MAQVHRKSLVTVGFALVGLGAALTLFLAPPAIVRTGDEVDYLRAASHLARHGVFSSAPLSAAAPSRDAYREPGYPAVLAVAWRLGGVAPPRAEAELRDYRFEPPARIARLLGGLVLALTAAAAAAAVHAAGGGPAASVATAALVLASPALRQAALSPGSEGLAAALVALFAFAWIRAVTRASAVLVVIAAVVAGLAPLVRGATLVLIPIGFGLLLLAPRELLIGRRLWRAAGFALLAAAPSVVWMTRNLEATGSFVLADRGGVVLDARAELDRQIAHEGLLPAVAAWTPIEAVRRAGERRWPGATYLRYEWQGGGNFFTRALRRWQAERRPPADPIAADRRLGREAMREFVSAPGRHLVATVAVAWRGLFAERSPEALLPLDLTFVLALLLAGAILRVGWLALRGRDWALAAFFIGPAALFLFHALFTEFLPRFLVPALPLAWGAVCMALCGAHLGPRRQVRQPADASLARSGRWPDE